jgi:proline iminopeptidase
MKRYRAGLFSLLLFNAVACLVLAQNESALPLWPKIEPFQTGYLKVSSIHEIYYELCGNPKGQPVFILHGGPGAGCSPYYRRFFNPEKYLIVLHDQRGAGKSRPFAELRENNTQNLVKDIETLRQHLKCGKVILFGGSWGSTLALAYAETYPDCVGAMVMRGVFTATRDEIDHYYHGGVRTFFPEAYEDLLSVLPDKEKRPLPSYILHLIQTADKVEGSKYSRAWARYETRIGMLEVPPLLLMQMAGARPDLDKSAYVLALMENYYMANDCFLAGDRLWKDLGQIASIPLVMVNGRYDMICPPLTAYRLHQKLPQSRLIIAEASGHWMGEKRIEQALLRAMKDFEKD